jgi:hypothetical protein
MIPMMPKSISSKEHIRPSLFLFHPSQFILFPKPNLLRQSQAEKKGFT